MNQLSLIDKPQTPKLQGKFRPRDYQQTAIRNFRKADAEGCTGMLLRMATGTGKTPVSAFIMDEWLRRSQRHRVMVLSYEKQLVWQFAQEIRDFIGTSPSIEMATQRIQKGAKPRIVVASRQSLCSRQSKDNDTPRLYKFDPEDTWLLIIDESHKCTYQLKQWGVILRWFDVNPNSRRIGLTATPYRGDGVSLSKVTPEVICDFPLYDLSGGPNAVDEGWCVEYDQRYVKVEGVDFKNLTEVAGDFKDEELEMVLGQRKALMSMIRPTMDHVGNRSTLVFCPTRNFAKMVSCAINAEIEKQHNERGEEPPLAHARYLDGTVNPEIRKAVYKAHQRGMFQFLVICNLCREGYNDPNVSAVAVFRPTKSKSLAEQMKGRGCRPLKGLVDRYDTAEERKDAIARSSKPNCLIVDLVGVTGLADMPSTATILASGKPDRVIERAERNAEKKEKVNWREEIRTAEEQLKREDEEKKRAEAARKAAERYMQREANRRAKIEVDVQYTSHRVRNGQGGSQRRRRDPIGHGEPVMPFGKHQGKPLSQVPTSYLGWVLKDLTSLRPKWKSIVSREYHRRRKEKQQSQQMELLNDRISAIDQLLSDFESQYE